MSKKFFKITLTIELGLIFLFSDLSNQICFSCTDDQRQQFQNCENACNNAGAGTVGCMGGCLIYGFFTGCVFSNDAELDKFKQYMKDKHLVMPEKYSYKQDDYIKLYEEYKNFKKSQEIKK